MDYSKTNKNNTIKKCKNKKRKNKKRQMKHETEHVIKDNSKNSNSKVHQLDVTTIQWFWVSSFFLTCERGDVDSVKDYLDYLDPNFSCDDMGYSPLHVSLEYKHKNVVEVLLRNGADPNFLGAKNSHPLHIICKGFNDDVDLANFFFKINDELTNPVHVNALDNMGNTPLHRALEWSHVKLAELLLKKGADPNLANEDGKTPLHIICTRYRSEKLVKLFFNINKSLGQTLQVDAKDKWGRTPLQLAVEKRWPDVIKVLLDNGADPSGIVFPPANYFEASLVPDPERCHWKLCQVSDVLAVLELLEGKGYDVDRTCVLKVMELFSKFELFEKSVDDNNSWYDETFAIFAKNILIKPNLSLNQLLQLQPKEEAKLLSYSDYFDFGCSRKLNCLLRSHRDGCGLRLCDKLSRRFLRPWAQVAFMELVHNRLPRDCCELVVDELVMSIDLYTICLAAEGPSQMESKKD